MAIDAAADGALAPVMAFALVGALGVGSQWLAWRLRMPAIVLMLAAGLLVGPGLGLFDPARDIGPLMKPMISVAVAIILFEGGLTLNLHSLRGAAEGVRRLVFLGAPLGWLFSALALHYVAGLGWAREAGLPIFVGNLLSDAAEHSVEFITFSRIVALSDNDAMNTLVTTNLAPEFGRENIYQLKPPKQEHRRHALPATLGGRTIAGGLGYLETARRMNEGWLVVSHTWGDGENEAANWAEAHPDAIPLAELRPGRDLRLIVEGAELNAQKDWILVAFAPPAD